MKTQLKKVPKFFKSIQSAQIKKQTKVDLSFLLSTAAQQKTLNDQLQWMSDFINWVKSPANQETESIVDLPSTRIKFLLSVLDRNEVWKKDFVLICQSILLQTSVFELLSETNLSQSSGFFSDLFERLLLKVLPQPQFDSNLNHYFTNLFTDESDAQWILKLEEARIQSLMQLLSMENRTHYENDFLNAIRYMSVQIQAIGLLPDIRKRMDAFQSIQEVPFYSFQDQIHILIDYHEQKKSFEFNRQMLFVKKQILECQVQIEQVYFHMNENGVSVQIVFMLEKMKSYFARIQNLLEILDFRFQDVRSLQELLSILIQESHQRKDIGPLFSQMTDLLSQRIAERNAETGTHYITKTRSEYWEMFQHAAGGGVVTAVTVYLKTFLSYLSLSGFFAGFLASLNYSVSFVFIQLAGFTLATKQPAMTAPALAAQMKNVESLEARENLINEIVCLIRSQMAGVLGNILLVIPTAFLVSFLFSLISDMKLIDVEHARHYFSDHVLYGPSFLYAAFTGVLLWFSGIVAGWGDNWFAFRNIAQAIQQNRTLHIAFGKEGTLKISKFFKKHVSGFFGNIALGLLLGLAPAYLKFFGLPIEVRHVTLASGTLAASFVSLGLDFVKDPLFWWAVFGVMLIGLTNLLVSFALAFVVAMKAKKVKAFQRKIILSLLWERFKSKPLSFIYPSSDSEKSV